MKATAVALRVTQSTISKRIMSLEDNMGWNLIVPQGRNIRLTEQAEAFLTDISPILADLNTVIGNYDKTRQKETISIGISEAILASWGAALINYIRKTHNSVALEIHTHRSALIVDKVSSGQYLLGICAGKLSLSDDIFQSPLWAEPMVIISKDNDLKNLRNQLRSNEFIDVITLERGSNTWRQIKGMAKKLNLRQIIEVESSFAAAQLAISGYANALVPLKVASTLNVMQRTLIVDPVNFTRQSTIIARKTQFNRPATKEIILSMLDYSSQIEA